MREEREKEKREEREKGRREEDSAIHTSCVCINKPLTCFVLRAVAFRIKLKLKQKLASQVHASILKMIDTLVSFQPCSQAPAKKPTAAGLKVL